MFVAQQPLLKHRLAFVASFPLALVRSRRIALVFAVLLGSLAVDALGSSQTLREFDLGIVKRRVEGNVTTIRVDRGDRVVLRWRADEAVTIHLHGYDLHAQLTSVARTDMRFLAGIAGRFPITAHEFGAATQPGAQAKRPRETTLLYLEVQPR